MRGALRGATGAVLAWSLMVPAGSGAASVCLEVPSFNERCEAWSAFYDDGTGTLDLAVAVASSHDGERVFVTGLSYVPGQAHPMFDTTTIAYDAATGEEIWSRRFDEVPDTWDQTHDIAVSPDGSRVFVAGLGGLDFRGGGDFLLLAYDADSGDPLWEGRYDGGSIDEAWAMAVAPDGEVVYLTGPSLGEGTDRDYATAAFDAATGGLLWSARYQGPGVDEPAGAAVSHQGDRVFVTGRSRGGAGDDYVTVAYETGDPQRLGEELWVARYEGRGGEDQPAGITLDREGSLAIVAGRSQAAGESRSEAATVAYESETGEQVWESRLGLGEGVEGASVATAGDLVVVGGSVAAEVAGREDRDPLLVAYRATTGSEVWRARGDLGALTHEAVTDLRAGPGDERIYAAGTSSPVAEYARSTFMTLAYRADTGARVWAARYESGLPDQLALPAALAVDPTGRRLFVAGAASTGPHLAELALRSNDYLTVAYDLGEPGPEP